MKPFEYLRTRVIPDVHCYLSVRQHDREEHESADSLLMDALHHSEAFQRGRCWCLLASHLQQRNNFSEMRALVERLFVEEFSVEPNPDAIAAWIDGLVHATQMATELPRHGLVDRYIAQTVGESDAEGVRAAPGSQLTHRLESVRNAALLQLGKAPPDPTLLERLVEIAMDPSSTRCQISACSAIGRLCSLHGDGELTSGKRCLARIVLNSTFSDMLRDVAYQSLHEAAKSPVHLWPCVLQANGEYSFPDGVDWQFVESQSRDSVC